MTCVLWDVATGQVEGQDMVFLQAEEVLVAKKGPGMWPKCHQHSIR